MRKKLPPLTSLEGFEAAARLGSFSAAAEALNLTQSAISHQIRMLEAALGQPVFRRLHRNVVLTDAGRDFQRSVAAVLDQLRAGVDRLEPYKKPGSVVVYCDAALANGWLAPRLPALKARHPRVDIWLDTTGRMVDFARDEVDILVRRFPQARLPILPRDVELHPLFAETLRPMAPPPLAAALRGLDPSRWPVQAPLLHEEGVDGWPLWFDRYGGGDPATLPSATQLSAGPNFSDAFVMLQSAAAGLGIALGWRRIAEAFIAGRQLDFLSDLELVSPNGYYIAASQDALEDPDIKAAFDWIRETAAS